MLKTKKEKLEKAGWTVGTTEQFLGKTEKELYKKKVIHTFSTVFDVLYEYDVQALIKMGCPVDEYSQETFAITTFLCGSNKENKNKLKEYVVKYFKEQFLCGPQEMSEEYVVKLEQMSEEILKRLEQL